MHAMRLTKSKARVLATISTDIAQVIFAVFVGTIVLPVDSAKVYVLLLELGFSVLFWAFSILFAEKGRL